MASREERARGCGAGTAPPPSWERREEEEKQEETTNTDAVEELADALSSLSSTSSSTVEAATSMATTPLPPPPMNRRLSGAGSHENFSPQIIMRLAKETRELMLNPPEGFVFVPNEEESLMEVYVDMHGSVGTPYEEGVFRIKLVLSHNYPHSPPRGFFMTKIYHPNVSTTGGDICVNTLKKDWSASLTLTHVLQVIRCLLIVPFPESSLNAEAGRLFMESYDEYAKRARLLTSVNAKAASAACAGKEGDCGKVSGEDDAESVGGGVNGSTAGVSTASLSSSSSSVVASDKSGAGGGSGGSSWKEEKVLVAKMQRSKDARRKSLKRL